MTIEKQSCYILSRNLYKIHSKVFQIKFRIRKLKQFLLMKQKKLNSERGLTLIEILIVLTVIAIASTFAISQFASSKSTLQRQGIVREFKVYLERARFDSVKRRAVDNDKSRVILNSPTAFTVISDTNLNGTIHNTNGTFEAGDIRQVDFTKRSATQIIVSNTLNYPVTILFDQLGHITAKDNLGNDVNPVFTICSSNCLDTSSNNPNSTVISVSTTGTVAILENGQTASALPMPVTNSSPPQFRCYVLQANANTSGCINN